MDDFQGTYAPQSPDLSGYQSIDQPDPFTEPYQPPPHANDQQQSSFYQKQPHFQQPDRPPHFDPFAPDPSHHPDLFSTMAPKGRTKSHFDDEDFIPEDPPTKPGRKSKKQRLEEDICDKPAPGFEEGIDVKTKFPVARIKRIMQADEDVGKVSQVTPTAVSKALELFIISLTLKSSAIARGKSSRRVTAAHLKQAVRADEQLDFLEQIVSKVPDAPTASSKSEGKKKGRETEEESSDEAYEEKPQPAKKRKSVAMGKRQRGKVGAGDDE